MPELIVTARADGRGGIKPFGKYGKKQAGAMVQIGDKKYKVTKDGRVNIPKRVMNNYGVTGKDGRKRIAINFSTKPGTKTKENWKNVAAVISVPDKASRNLKTGTRPLVGDPEQYDDSDDLMPETEEDYAWS